MHRKRRISDSSSGSEINREESTRQTRLAELREAQKTESDRKKEEALNRRRRSISRENESERTQHRQANNSSQQRHRERENESERTQNRHANTSSQQRHRERENENERTQSRHANTSSQQRHRERETFAQRSERLQADLTRHRIQVERAGWLSVENGMHIETHDAGPFDCVCEFCGALYFRGTMPKCCKQGKIYHEPPRNLPPGIELLLLREGKKFNDFRSKIVVYNNLAAMGSINYSHIDVPSGIPVTKVQGLVMHNYSHARPYPGKPPKYGQMYAYFDIDMPDDIRRESAMQGNTDPAIDVEIVLLIQEKAMEVNPLVMQYQSMGDLLRDFETKYPGEKVPRKYMYIKDAYKDVEKYLGNGEYQSQYSKIRADQAAFLYESDREGRPKGPGIWVNFKMRGRIPKTLPHYHPLVDPLCYILINFYGEPGYDYRSDAMKYQTPVRRFGPLAQSTNRETADANLEASQSEDSGGNSREGDRENQRRRDEQSEDIGLQSDDEAIRGASSDEEAVHFNNRASRSCILSSSDEEEIETDEDENQDETANVNEAGEVMSEEMQRQFRTMLEGIMPGRQVTTEDEEMETDEDNGNEPDTEPEPPEEPRPVLHRMKQSMAEYFNYKMQLRQSDKDRNYHSIFSTKKLGQLYACDAYMRVIEQRHDFARKKRVEKRLFNEEELEKAIAGIEDDSEESLRQSRQFVYRNRRAEQAGCVLGAQIFSTPEVTGSARYYRKKMEDAMAIVHECGKPDLFVTFTGNPRWKEIEDNLLPYQNWTDAPMLVVQVFRAKMIAFLEDVIDKAGFGKVKAFAWSVEYQKRGMPHVHLLLTLEEGWKMDNTAQIDKFIFARIPEAPENASSAEQENYEKLRTIVLRHQIHTPCSGKPNAYCRKATKNPNSLYCGKHFPHKFNEFTMLGEKGYAEPWRPKDNEAVQENGKVVDNSWIVSYSPKLSLKYSTHINVEVCSNVLACKYIYKYVYKGTDKVLIGYVDGLAVDCGTEKGAVPEMKKIAANVILPKAINPNVTQITGLQNKAVRILEELKIPKKLYGRPVVLYDELAIEEQLMCITAPEATYGIADNPRARLSHSVTSLEVHKPKSKNIVSKPETNPIDVAESVRRGDYVSQMEAWFKLNQTDPAARSLTYNEAAHQYILRKSGHKWEFKKKRQQRIDKALVRIRPVNPRYLETYAIRELSMNTKGATSFDDLKKVQSDTEGPDVIFPSFSEAAKARRLMNGEREWRETMAESVEFESPQNIRRIFASILMYGSTTKDLPIELWNEYWELMCDRGVEQGGMRREHFKACALFHIERILQYNNLKLSDFGLPEVDQNVLLSDAIPNEVRARMFEDIGTSFTAANSNVEHEKMFKMLNKQQKKIHNEIVHATLERKAQRLFAVMGSGGTGKTYLYKTIYHRLNSEGKQIAMCAHTGIAAQLLIDGSTIHRYFWIDSTDEAEIQSKIHAGTAKAEELRNLDVLIWDEVSMSDRNLISAVDQVLRYVTGQNLPFGGKVVIVGGDFKQLLPVVPGENGPDIVEETILHHPLWIDFKKLVLTKNIRAQEDVNFAAMLEEVGHGLHTEADRYPVCTSCFPLFVESEKEIIEWTFGNGQAEDVNKIRGTCILATLNEETIKINEKILSMLPGYTKQYVSIDQPDETRGMQMPPEYFHKELDSNMPPHELNLKEGCITILLKNLDVRKGLCNGSRLLVKKLHDNYVVCNHLDPSKVEDVMITRMMLRPKLRTGKPMYTRTQLPLRLAYSMTVHKAQGQTMDKVGLFLKNPVFAHGHLYTGLSRVRKAQHLRIFTNDDKGETDANHRKEKKDHKSVVLLKNIVYANVFSAI